MPKAAFNASVFYGSPLQPGDELTEVTVTNLSGGSNDLWADRNGLSTKSNPFFIDETGIILFYADPGRYTIVATREGESTSWENVILMDDVSAGGGGGTVESVVGGTGISVDSASPSSPVVGLSGIVNVISTASTAISLTSANAGNHYATSGASPVITIPTGLPTGWTVSGFHTGTGNITFSVAGITLRYNSALAPTVPQYGAWQIVHQGSNVVELFGFLNLA